MFKKRLVIALLSFFCLALVALPQAMNKAPLFKTGICYTLYAGSESSNARMLVCREGREWLDKLLAKGLTGESASYGDTHTALSEAKRLDTHILFVEYAAGITNYYGYSPRLSGGVTVNGERVNVHVAVSDRGSAIGTPIIFGGF